MAILPPVRPPIYLLEKFWWCQVEFVFTHELLRKYPKMPEQDAYKEAREAAKALKASGKPLSIGAELDEVNWEQLICAANAYAHIEDPKERENARKAIANGASTWAILSVLSEPDMCDLKVLDDPQYSPSPSCVPNEVMTAAGLAGACMLWTFGCVLLFRTFADRR
jgi:hypothetical protein